MVSRIATSVLFGAALSAGAMVQAGVLLPVISETSDAAANAVTWNGTGNETNDQDKDNLRVGRWNSNTYRNAVFVFKLPTLPAGETVASAQFNVDYWGTQVDVTGYSVDAVAVRVAATSDVWASDFGIAGGDKTLLQSNFVTAASEGSYGGNYTSLDATGQTTLGGFLASNYVAGNYVFISLNANAAVAQDGGYSFFNSRKTGTGNFVPQLVITAVPEPALLGLIGMGVVGLLGCRRAR